MQKEMDAIILVPFAEINVLSCYAYGCGRSKTQKWNRTEPKPKPEPKTSGKERRKAQKGQREHEVIGSFQITNNNNQLAENDMCGVDAKKKNKTKQRQTL